MTPLDEKEMNEILWMRTSEAKILKLIEEIVREMFESNQNKEESVALYAMFMQGAAIKIMAMCMDMMNEECHKQFLKDTNTYALDMLMEKKKFTDGFH
jgi:hypothetical protein